MWPLPTSWILGGAGLALAASLAWGGAQTMRVASRDATIARIELQGAQRETELQANLAAATNELRAREEAQRIKEREATNAAQKAISEVRADVDAQRSAAERLRQRTETVASGCAIPGSAAASTPGTDAAPGRMLANMQRRIVEAAGRIGEYADQAVIDAQSCEAAWPR